ncbi:AMP-binding protein [Halobacteriovorax sp. JY17]|uniref:phenylacetate--CoA ligase family protein n=1 Tax=Halobacteriovorax sp. JY17 TaxID=2014617 RepID=UPI000C5F0B9D|nr:AMP-binding protein [Halobacteriovorax sp. JY17]PIK14983.1 MAG: hypothetical protein CES88_11660 [Halobacteriovorax sp. JY17]
MNNRLREHILFVREKSEFYRNLYQDVNQTTFSLSDLPILNQESFWGSNGFDNNTVLTSTQPNGVVFKSGGTTGTPKSSYFTQEEWEVFTSDFAFGMDQLNLKEGDRCANLFYSGDLYASFLFINKSVEKLKSKVVQYPITGQTSLEETRKIIENFKINTLFGVPTSLLNLANQFKEKNSQIEHIYYGGEPLFEDQKEKLLEKFPCAHISSIGYASVDGGQLGYVNSTCLAGEHIVFENTIMEIVDIETNKVISETNKVGKLVYTNLSRRLMPIIRYPVGDMATWVEVGTKFKLLGRSDEGARVGPVTISRDDILSALKRSSLGEYVQNIQLVIKRDNGRDYLHVYLGVESKVSLNISESLRNFKEHFALERPMYQKEKNADNIGELEASIVLVDDLQKNPRTGKLRLVIDERFS